jgi:hypothetical protein
MMAGRFKDLVLNALGLPKVHMWSRPHALLKKQRGLQIEG